MRQSAKWAMVCSWLLLLASSFPGYVPQMKSFRSSAADCLKTYLSALNSIPDLTQEQLDIIPAHVLSISRATALILLAAFLM